MNKPLGGIHAPIFRYENGINNKFVEIENLEDFDIEVLKQSENKHGVRTITQEVIYNGDYLDDFKSYPQWRNSEIVGYVIQTQEQSILVGEEAITGVHLAKLSPCLFAIDSLQVLEYLSRLNYSAIFDFDIYNAFDNVDKLDETKPRLIITDKPLTQNADLLLCTPDQLHGVDDHQFRQMAMAKARTIKPEKAKLNIINASDIQAEPIKWLWREWLPMGKLTLLAGVGGCGKTNVALSLASVVSHGSLFPDGTPCEHEGKVLIYSTEDDPSDVLIPRLLANGANLQNVLFLQGRINEQGKKEPFDPEQDLQKLIEYIQETGDLRLVIIDPIVSLVKGDTNDNAKVRTALEPLVRLCMQSDVALIGITHFSKGSTGGKTAHRVMGAQAFVAISRMIWVASKKDGENDGILAIAKCNIATDDKGVKYHLQGLEVEQGIFSTKIEWGEVVKGSSSELIAEYDKPKEFDNVLDEAKDFLCCLLTDNERMTFKDIESKAKEQGISRRTLERAKTDLGIKSKLVYETSGRAWYWILPVQHRLDEPPI